MAKNDKTPPDKVKKARVAKKPQPTPAVNPLVRILVVYDGNYFSHVSNYYNHVHSQKRRLHIGGLHKFIQHEVAKREGTIPKLCPIIEAHFFRGRFSAKDADERPNQLYYDRVFEDVLMWNSIQPHYLPVRDLDGRKREKGIDGLLIVETYKLCLQARFDVVVLIASDGDHVPLVREIHALKCKTMLLGWDFEYKDERTKESLTTTTRTSADLRNSVCYSLDMSDVIDTGLAEDNQVIQDVFVLKNDPTTEQEPEGNAGSDILIRMRDYEDTERHVSQIMSLHKGYGFISFPDNNVFFLRDDLDGVDFDSLKLGDMLEFSVATNTKGQRVAKKITRAKQA